MILLFTLSWWYPFFFIVSRTPLKKGYCSSLKPALKRCRIVTFAGYRLVISVLSYSFICLKMLQSLKESLLILFMCS